MQYFSLGVGNNVPNLKFFLLYFIFNFILLLYLLYFYLFWVALSKALLSLWVYREM